MVSTSRNKKGRFLPEPFDIAHELCFVIHDVMVQIIKSGEEANIFTTTLDLKNDHERKTFENTDDLFTWLETEERFDDRTKKIMREEGARS